MPLIKVTIRTGIVCPECKEEFRPTGGLFQTFAIDDLLKNARKRGKSYTFLHKKCGRVFTWPPQK